MKPFTLEWWMKMLSKARNEENRGANILERSLGESGADHANRYMHLGNWIYDRIINKYGEQDD